MSPNENVVLPLDSARFTAGEICFLRAEWMTGYPPRVAWIFHTICEEEREAPLRFDLLKECFLDHFPEPEEEAREQSLLSLMEPLTVLLREKGPYS